MLIAAGHAAPALDDPSDARRFARYEPMMQRSPFAAATAPPATLPLNGNFPKHWYIARIEWLPETDVVTFRSTADPHFELTVSTKEPMNGISISNIGCDGNSRSRGDSRAKEKE